MSPGALLDTPVDFSPSHLVGIGDMDQDGWTDLVFGDDVMLFVLRGAGDCSFLGTLAYELVYGAPMVLADFDGNGRLDVGVVEDVAQMLRWRVYRNELCQ